MFKGGGEKKEGRERERHRGIPYCIPLYLWGIHLVFSIYPSNLTRWASS